MHAKLKPINNAPLRKFLGKRDYIVHIQKRGLDMKTTPKIKNKSAKSAEG
jgi:hypothetical protein